MDIQNISGSDYVSRGFHSDPTPKEETYTRETEEPVETPRSVEPGKGQNLDTYA